MFLKKIGGNLFVRWKKISKTDEKGKHLFLKQFEKFDRETDFLHFSVHVCSKKHTFSKRKNFDFLYVCLMIFENRLKEKTLFVSLF